MISSIGPAMLHLDPITIGKTYRHDKGYEHDRK